MIGPKVKFLYLAMFALFLKFGARFRPQDLWPFVISETGMKFLIWTQGEINLGNWAHVKRSLKEAFALSFCTVSLPER